MKHAGIEQDDFEHPLLVKEKLAQWVEGGDKQAAMRSLDAALMIDALFYLDILKAIERATQ